jgi:hypothetical protein
MISMEHESFCAGWIDFLVSWRGEATFINIQNLLANGAVAQMVEQRAVSARRWMFDSSPLHFNLFRNRNVMLAEK